MEPRRTRSRRGLPPCGTEGVTALEYALLAALIAVVIIIAVMGLGDEAQTLFQNVASHVSTSTS